MSDYRTPMERLEQEIIDLRAQLAAATDGVRDWKNAHALLKEQFHKQRELLEAATKRIEEAEKQEPVAWYMENDSYATPMLELTSSTMGYHESWSKRPLYLRPIPPADVANCPACAEREHLGQPATGIYKIEQDKLLSEAREEGRKEAVPPELQHEPLRADESVYEQEISGAYINGWNACRTAMLAAAPSLNAKEGGEC